MIGYNHIESNMTTYKQSGVDMELGDLCSAIAYAAAKKTFANRKGKIGEPAIMEGGFSGAMDFGEFYIVQNDDGVGTKIQVATLMNKYDTLGFDLVAMVVDDGICLGAEMISVSNTIDCNALDPHTITELMKGLEAAARVAGIVVPGGEIAELGEEVKGYIWNATAVGIVKKDRMFTGEKVRVGDSLVGLYNPGFRSNGFTLVRRALEEKLGKEWHQKPFAGTTYGDAVLVPSPIYCSAITAITGGYKDASQAPIHGLAHITGGGIPGNLPRMFGKQKLGAELTNLFAPDPIVLEVQRLGNVSDRESYQVWNMGTGMILATPEPDLVIQLLQKHNVTAQVIGKVTGSGKVTLVSKGAEKPGATLEFDSE